MNGLPRPFGYGQSRIAGNIGWYGDLITDFIKNSTGGGSGGGGGGKSGASSGTFVYYVDFLLLLCEGPIDSVVQGWESKSAFPFGGDSTLGPDFVLFDGDYQQEPWSYLQQNYPQAAQNFRGLAYAADSSIYLGTNSELPNMTFDVRFNIADGLVETATVPSVTYSVTAQYFNYDYGVLGHFTVPNSSPYLVVPGLNPTILSGLAEGINNSTLGDSWYLSNSSGVIWDIGASNGTPGQPLIRVTGSPSTGEYVVGADDTPEFTFAAADAGQPVIIIAAALSPGVCYATQITGVISKGSNVVSAVSPNLSAVSLSQRVLLGNGIPPGTFVTGLQSGSATGNTASGSTTIGSLAGNFTAIVGQSLFDSAGAIPGNATIVSTSGSTVTAGANSALTATNVTFTVSFPTTGYLDGTAQLTGVASFGGIAIGALASAPGYIAGIPVVSFNSGAGTVQLASNPSIITGQINFTFSTQFSGSVEATSPTISNASSIGALTTSSTFVDSVGAFPPNTAINSIGVGSIVISHGATATVIGDYITFGASFTMSNPASINATEAIVLRGAPMTQVLPGSEVMGSFSLSIQAGAFGEYTFSSGDQGVFIAIIDLPDANPADVLTDFLTNPYYGMTQFPATCVGDLTQYRTYCLAAGLLVSPLIGTVGAANQFITDLMAGTNSAVVWSGTSFTVVPYGDAVITANGVTFTPNLTPVYSFTDNDFMAANQTTNPKSQASSQSPDPLTVTRNDPFDQQNDIQVEYLDRANIYNPTIAEAKDDASIATVGLKSSGSKQMHMFCVQSAALQSAQLQLGRQQVQRTIAFTLGPEYILLDPMDPIEVTDISQGVGQIITTVTQETVVTELLLNPLIADSTPLYWTLVIGPDCVADCTPNYEEAPEGSIPGPPWGSLWQSFGNVGDEDSWVQTLTTTPGSTVVVGGWLCTPTGQGGPDSNFSISWNGVPVITVNPLTDMPTWTQFTASVIATGSDVFTVTFRQDPGISGMGNFQALGDTVVYETATSSLGSLFRVTEITENEDRTLSVTAEEIPLGAGNAPGYGHQSPAPTVVNYNIPAPTVGTPTVFDAPVQVQGVMGMATIFAVNADLPNFGGADIWIASSEFGEYSYATTLYGGSTTGTLTASLGTSAGTVAPTISSSMSASQGTIGVSSGTGLPAFVPFTMLLGTEYILVQQLAGTVLENLTRGYNGSTAATHSNGTTIGLIDPDQSNSLAVDLTQSQGTLLPGTQTDADQFNTLCLVDDELVSYEQATLTAQYKYVLGKDGSTPGYLRRGVDGSTITSHAPGAPFVRLRAGSFATVPYPSSQIGQTIWIKVLAFNQWGGGKQTLTDVSPVSHTLAAPPSSISGLLPGLIVTPDLAENTATNQVTVATTTPITVSTSGGATVLLSATITTVGGPVQINYAVQAFNAAGATDYVDTEWNRDAGAATFSIKSPAAPAVTQAVSVGASLGVSWSDVDDPAAGTHTYTLLVSPDVAAAATMVFSNGSLSLTETRR